VHCAFAARVDVSPVAEACAVRHRVYDVGMRVPAPIVTRFLAALAADAALAVCAAHAALAGLGLGAAGTAHAQTGLVLQAGVRAGSGFKAANGSGNSSNGEESLQLRSGAAGSVAYEWSYDDRRLWQVLLSRQHTQLALGPAAAPGSATQLPLQLTHLHLGGVNYFDGPVGSGPYVVGGLGFTHLAPNLPGTDSRTRASMNLGIGHEWALAPRLAWRVELRAHFVLINSSGAFFCAGGGCTVSIRGDALTQAEAAVALRVGF